MMTDNDTHTRAQRLGIFWQKSRLLFVGLSVGLFVGRFVLNSAAEVSEGAHGAHDSHKSEAEGEGEAEVWTCSMHPQVRAPEAGKCPICAMDLIPVPRSSQASHAQARAHQGEHDARVELSERAKILAKLRTHVVGRLHNATAAVRLLGRVEVDESRLRTVTAWTGGRIDRLHVNVTGKKLTRGQIIATLYSPEVLAAHQDLIVARQQSLRLAEFGGSSARVARAALTAARERLSLLGVPKQTLAAMESAEKPTRAVAIRSPFSGTLMERLATEGAYVKTGAALYRLADLTHLWVQLDVYESDLAQILVGQKVELTVEALPGEGFTGMVTFVEPILDSTRRTTRVRVEVDNHDSKLRPGMFVEATVRVEAVVGGGNPLVVPATAPLFTGRRAIVYVESEVDGRLGYEPTTVRLGPRLGSHYPVVAGLSEGQRVVSRGAFALDADLQIRGGRSMMSADDDLTPDRPDSPISMPGVELARLESIVLMYLKVQRSLAIDDLTVAKGAAQELEKDLAGVRLKRPQAAAKAWRPLATLLRDQAMQVGSAIDLEQARSGFEALSQSVTTLLRLFGNPLKEPVHLAFCPMAMGSDGATWLQQGTDIDNAYFGASMRSCGELTDTLAPGDHLSPDDTPDQKVGGASSSGGAAQGGGG